MFTFVLTGASAHAASFTVGGAHIGDFDCSGGNKSPSLKWTNAPKDTKSFAVTVYDLDAPVGSSRWRWMVVNIPAATVELKADAGRGSSLPAGAEQVRLDQGFAAWSGVCPSTSGRPHRYLFTVYALRTTRVELPAGATADRVRFKINANQIGRAVLTARYGLPE
jgi:Raf kinase inhibitor-like YbhB/YbcL family protein